MSSSQTRPTPAIQKLSVEVWLNICEELLGKEGYGNRVLPLLLVCRKWKDVFTPALHRHLRLDRTSGRRMLDRLYIRLASSDLSGNPVGQWCHSLDIDLFSVEPTDEKCTSLQALLLYLPNLRSFTTLPGSSIKASDLDALTRTCKDSLRSLSVAVSGVGSLGGLGLGFISRLTRLTHLSVTVHWGADSTVFSVDSAPGFNMPSLKSLSWSAIDQPIPPYLTFLSRCNFPAIERLELGLPALRVQSVPFLAPFLERYSPNITKLNITQPPAAPTLCALLQSTRPEHVTFAPQAPSPSIVRDIPLSVRHLHLNLESGGPVADGLWELLNTICTTDTPLSLTDINLHPKDGSGFFWTDIHLIPPEFAIRLVRVALRLADKRIFILDAQGKGIQMSRPTSAA